MRGFMKAALALGLVAAISTPALAQGRGGYGGGQGGGVNLIGNPSVQKELKIDDAQKEKIQGFVEAQRAKMTELRSQLENLDQQERMAKMQEINRKNTEEGMKTLATILKPEQEKRFKQIVLQQRGVQALADPVVAKELNVTSDQTSKVQAILANEREEMADIRESANGDFQAMQPKIAALRKETTTKVMGLMTEDQKKTWKEMTGEPFEVQMQPGQGRGGRGGRGGN